MPRVSSVILDEELRGKSARTVAKASRNGWIFPYGFLVFVPVSLILEIIKASPLLIGIATLVALLPLTTLIARATEELSVRSGTFVGSMLNATFGNAIEFMVAVFAIRAGLVEMVRTSIIGSIILNILLLIGLSMFFGGLKHHQQTFNRDSAGVGSTMLLLAVAGLAMPTLYAALTGQHDSWGNLPAEPDFYNGHAPSPVCRQA